MGACNFENFQPGSDLTAAFNERRERALYDHGHAGYSGTIAEKDTAILRRMEPFTSFQEARDWANADLDNGDHDKWGPAWAVRVNDPEKGEGFLFYGYASS